MTHFSFFKYHGLGNDFILIPKTPCLTPEAIKASCHRYTGIGADGVIFVFKTNSVWSVKFFNSDGSMASMCGNGFRCVAQYLKDQGHEFERIRTDSGTKTCFLQDSLWVVDMGLAQVSSNQVDIGNKHLILEGPANTHQINPEININFFELINSKEFRLRVFERGVGETQACATGACATTAYLVNNHRIESDQEVRVHLKGGTLYTTARRTASGLNLLMKGPAQYVFNGKV